jgi:phenylalanine-4-hydroxylase
VVLNSGVQVSGIVEKFENQIDRVDFVKFTGPTQISFEDRQLSDHGKDYHAEGFSSPIGKIVGIAECPSEFSDAQWEKLGLELGQKLTLNYVSGFKLEGIYSGRTIRNKKTILMKFKDATITNNGKIYYQPDWGPLDLVLGSSITSVFSGPADRLGYGQNDDFIVKKVATKKPSATDSKIFEIYSDIRHMRTKFNFESAGLPTLKGFFNRMQELDPKDWLAILEIYELLVAKKSILSKESGYEDFVNVVKQHLDKIKKTSSDNADSIEQGLQLAAQP